MTDFLKLAQEAYDASTSYVDANLRADWDYSIRAFRNEHAAGSKYLSEEYKARSRIFRPKTRSIIRKNEAAGAVALFSNMETVNIEPGNPDDPISVASAAALKAVVEYRLTRTIPAFQLVMGALQDAQTQGTVISYQYWEYQKKGDKVIKDKPCIDLIPIENIRIDAGASWIDPVETSPYLCHIMPMKVCEVRAMMNSTDAKTGAPKWKKYNDAEIAKARPETIDTTRKARLGNKEDPQQDNAEIGAYDTVWVMRWFVRDEIGDDYTFYTLGTDALLTDPKPIEKVYFHGKRPYVIGHSVLESHKVFKTGVPILVKQLQVETNDVANQRLDNVKFVLNKRWLVARGRQVDVQSLVRNVPGGVTLATDPNTDIKESNWPDVTSSSYVEQDRINADLDELAGNFSPSTKVANNAVNDTLGGSKLAAQGAGMMTDYLLRTFIETWWEPVLRQLVLLEQYYETDQIVLGVCAQKARLFPRFNISAITDDLLAKEVNVSVNVGMGASDPNQRFQKLLGGTNAVLNTIKMAPPNFNVDEFIKEAYSNMGYRDGSRFWNMQQDPRLMQAMQMVEQLQQALKGKQMEMQQTAQLEAAKIQSGERIKAAELQVDYQRISGDLRIREAELIVEQQKLELEKLKLQAEVSMAGEEHNLKLVEIGEKINEARAKLQAEQQKITGQALKIAADIEKGQREIALLDMEKANVSDTSKVVSQVQEMMTTVASELSAVGNAISTANSALAEIDSVKMGIQTLGEGFGALVSQISNRKKPSGFALKKDESGKTKAVAVTYNDGSSEEMPVS